MIDRSSNRNARWIKVSVVVRTIIPIMNRDERGYRLSHIWGGLLVIADGILLNLSFSKTLRTSLIFKKKHRPQFDKIPQGRPGLIVDSGKLFYENMAHVW